MMPSSRMLSVTTAILLPLMQSIPVMRSECINGALLRAQCSSLSKVRSLLLHDSLSDSVRIRCDYPASSYSWTKSDDGSEANAVMLDTSEEKYTIIRDNSLDIGLSRVTGSDGGLYRCVYGGIGTTSELCVYVYERAVFSSCPQEYSGCSKEVPLSVTSGNPATFNASITYTPGGSCDFKQAITRIKLLKKSNDPSQNLLLFSCRTDQGAACINNDADRLSLSRGNGLDFVFTLSNTHQNDSGEYEVVVEGTHPATSSLITIKKTFHLNVAPAPPSVAVPFGVQALCSAVVWYSPAEVSCAEGTVNGYEVRFYDPNFIQSNVTRYVGTNRTFYGITEGDRLAGENTHVQVRILYNSAVGPWSKGISTGCEQKQASLPTEGIFSVYFMLNGTVYLNNSAVPLLGVGEGDHALQCRTSREECCRTLPNRFGKFFYPNGTEVFNERSGYGFHRSRGQKVIHLNRRSGVTSPAGNYRCEVPDVDGEMKSIFVDLTE